MARASLCGFIAMFAPACLVTSSPSFEDPERTPPFLGGPSARPDLRRITVVDSSSGPMPKVEFSATVRSEDNDAKVLGRLVLDYGVLPVGGPAEQPYAKRLTNSDTSLDPSTFDDTSRTLGQLWYPKGEPATTGCHTVTLLATHEFDEDLGDSSRGCPLDPQDFDFLTWTVYFCDSMAGSCCDPTLPAEEGGCQSFVCPDTNPDIRCDIPADGAGAGDAP